VTDRDLRARVIANLVACAADPAASLTDAARELREHELVVLPSPKDMVRFLKELSDQVGPNLEHYGEVKADDAQEPALMGTHGPDGFVVSVFTSDETAREHAVTVGAIEPTAALMFSTRRWLPALREFRADGYAGLVVDDGAPHCAALDRAGLERLWAALEADRFEGAAELVAVTKLDQLHTERRPDGFVYAFVFVDGAEAALSMDELRKYGAFDSAVRAKAPLLEELRARGVERLKVDHGFQHQHVYTPDEFVPLLGGHVEPPATPAAGGAAPDPALGTLAAGDAERGTPEGDSLLELAASGPALPPLPPTADDTTSRAVFTTWQKQASQQTCEVWQFLDALTYGTTLYVTVAPEPFKGLKWPVFHRVTMQPENTSAAMVYLFTSEAAVSAFVAERPPEARAYERLSALEVFRWIWAYPGEGTHLSIDYPDEAGWITFPLHWLRHVFLPIGRDYGDLSKISRVPLSKLGGVGGAPRLNPEATKALSLGWKPLMSVKPGDAGAPALVERDGASFLPVFSDPEQFFAYASAQKGTRVVPDPPAGHAPFARWLEATRGQGGVVLDPAGAHPLTLDRTTLVLLDRCAELGRYPGMAEYVAGVARHHGAGLLTDAELGRALAEVPAYFMGLGPKPDGGAFVLHMPNDPDTGVLFTTEAAAEAFMSGHGVGPSAAALWNAAVQRQPPAGIRAVGRASRWFASPLATMEHNFSQALIDPAPDGSGGCRLDRTGLLEATGHLRRVLQPRIGGFVWGA
jgi:hypothetical protein